MTNLEKNLLDFCAEIYAYCDLDREITIHGCGVNSSEACRVANGIMDILKENNSNIKDDLLWDLENKILSKLED